MGRTTPDPDGKRFLVDRRVSDRRYGGDRRRRDRRVLHLPVERERRAGVDRRVGLDRRAARAERRLPPAAQFSWDETRTIQLMLTRLAQDVACPRCQGVLLLGPFEKHGGVTTREVHCTNCRNSAVIVD